MKELPQTKLVWFYSWVFKAAGSSGYTMGHALRQNWRKQTVKACDGHPLNRRALKTMTQECPKGICKKCLCIVADYAIPDIEVD